MESSRVHVHCNGDGDHRLGDIVRSWHHRRQRAKRRQRGVESGCVRLSCYVRGKWSTCSKAQRDLEPCITSTHARIYGDSIYLLVLERHFLGNVRPAKQMHARRSHCFPFVPTQRGACTCCRHLTGVWRCTLGEISPPAPSTTHSPPGTNKLHSQLKGMYDLMFSTGY